MKIKNNELMRGWLIDFGIEPHTLSNVPAVNDSLYLNNLTQKLFNRIQNKKNPTSSINFDFWDMHSKNRMELIGELNIDFEQLNYFNAVKISFESSMYIVMKLVELCKHDSKGLYIMFTYSLSEQINSNINWGQISGNLPIDTIDNFKVEGILCYTIE